MMMLVMAFCSAFVLSSCNGGDEDNSSPNKKNEKHEAVDLGLLSGIKWAVMNVGALSPEDSGYHFAWGETEPKLTYEEGNYKLYDSVNGQEFRTEYMTKYNKVDNKTTLELEDDAAHANWGGLWRMPTEEEWGELRKYCKWTWTTINEVKGYRVTGPNGKSIFLPAAGCIHSTGPWEAGCCGYYWSSSLISRYMNGAYGLYFNLGDVGRADSFRYNGFSVRAVCP